MTNIYQQTAKRNHDMGANVTCISEEKKPWHPWKRWQTERQPWDVAAYYSWRNAIGTGIICGVNGWHCFDIDKSDGPEVVAALLAALGLPPDYKWLVRTGSGRGWHVWIRCDDRLPSGVLTMKASEPGVFWGLPKEGFAYDHLEVRWEHCQTLVPPSQHTTGPGYKYVSGEPTEPPAKVSVGHVLAAYFAVAVTKGTDKEPPVRAEPKPRAADAQDDKDNIRQRFDLLAYALKRFPGETQEDGDEIRILGHGGLDEGTSGTAGAVELRETR